MLRGPIELGPRHHDERGPVGPRIVWAAPRQRLGAREDGEAGVATQYDSVVSSVVRPALRIALAVALGLGLAAVVYGTASLTGGWLGTPPWWLVLTAVVAGVVAIGVGISRAMGDGDDDISRLNRSGNPPEWLG